MVPLYQVVKQHVLSHIASGAWTVGHRVPSEHELLRALRVSRMTVNRALRELTNDGILTRVAGVGTFVADWTAHGHPLQIKNIRDEIRARGHAHSAKIIVLETVRATEALAHSFGVSPKARLFHSVMIHRENGVPIQVEDRHVSPAAAPNYLRVDFTKLTPHEHLMAVAPLQSVEHVLRAELPDRSVRTWLDMKPGEPCLLLMRRTWAKGQVATTARLHYPASRYEFLGSFKP